MGHTTILRLPRLVLAGCNLDASIGLTKKAEPPPTRDVNRDSGTDSANGGWLRRLVRPLVEINMDCDHASQNSLAYIQGKHKPSPTSVEVEYTRHAHDNAQREMQRHD
jgi:hypothetical protein